MRTAVFAVCTCVFLLSGCQPDSSATKGGEGGFGGTATAAGGAGGVLDPGGDGPCVCEPVPECSDPADFKAWCSGYGPGVNGATRCKGCGPTECTSQPGDPPACFDSELWCCVEDFNPEPVPKLFVCIGSVMCETAPDTFEVVCDYEEDVTALDAKAAAASLVAQCNAENPTYKCGLWTLECEAA